MLKVNKYYEYYADFDSKWADDEYEYNKGEIEEEELDDYAESLNRAEERFYDAVESHFEDFELPFETDNLKIFEIYSSGHYVKIIFKLIKDMEDEDIKKEIREKFDYTRWVKFFGYEIEVGLYSGKYYKTCVKETIEESDYITEEDQEENKNFKNSVMEIKNTTEYFNVFVIDDRLEDLIEVEECNKREWPIFKNIIDIEENNHGEKINEYSKDKMIEFMQKYRFWIGKTAFIPDGYNNKENVEDFYNFDNLNGKLEGWTGIVYGFSINKFNEIHVVISDCEQIYIKE